MVVFFLVFPACGCTFLVVFAYGGRKYFRHFSLRWMILVFFPYGAPRNVILLGLCITILVFSGYGGPKDFSPFCLCWTDFSLLWLWLGLFSLWSSLFCPYSLPFLPYSSVSPPKLGLVPLPCRSVFATPLCSLRLWIFCSGFSAGVFLSFIFSSSRGPQQNHRENSHTKIHDKPSPHKWWPACLIFRGSELWITLPLTFTFTFFFLLTGIRITTTCVCGMRLPF